MEKIFIWELVGVYRSENWHYSGKSDWQHCNIIGGRPYRERDTMYAAAPIAKNLELTGWHADIKIEQGISNYIKTNFSYE